MSSTPNDFNERVIEEFRPNEGRVAAFDGNPILLLHHVGASSGIERVNPLAYQSDEGRYVIFASKAGAPSNPAWYHNLKAHPEVTIEVGTETLRVTATEAQGRSESASTAPRPNASPCSPSTRRRQAASFP